MTGQSPRRRVATALATVLAALTCSIALVAAFAEEPITFRDPYSGELSSDEISTLHDDLTYVLALAAGFSVSDSITLQIWNQLVDSEQIVGDESIAYSNCQSSFQSTPAPASVCPRPGIYPQVAWPLWDQMKDVATCATSRFSPYSPFFHFPHQNAAEIGALHD